MYAPLGTRMTLGDHVRVAKTFLEAFKVAQDHSEGDHVELKRELEERERLLQDLKVDDSIHHTRTF